ncbi:unnamed protein product [Rotaria sordida]|uniref:F-box domain-containing protein n=1 Tax=Rotaria sordida TaxID=392033 RepID=A0A815J937_9BILA|nr:unnamed protein product [Rotaria sordida]CAF3563808.1 unnamed protein product [Rotaria sordida]
MSSNDKDLRFQAVANLMNDLRQQSFKLDDDSEYHVVQGVLKLLEDTNSEVLNQVVQCIALLLYKVNGLSFNRISDALCSTFKNVSTDTEKLHDMKVTSLKTIFASLLQQQQAIQIFNPPNIIMDHLVTVIVESSRTKANRSNGRLHNAGHGEIEILDLIRDTLSTTPDARYKFFLCHVPLSRILRKNLESPRADIRPRVPILIKKTRRSMSIKEDTNSEVKNQTVQSFEPLLYKVGLLDLPNEILLMIFKKLGNIDVLYSLLDVDNQRLDIIAQENTFTNTLKFLIITLTDDILSLTDSIVDRFCTNILPRIHQNVKSLILDSLSMERILLVGDYPNLTEIKLFNFNDKIVSRYFTVETPFRCIFQRQIADLILVFENDFNEILEKNYTTDHLSIMGSFPRFFPPLVLRNLPSTTFFSSTLNKLYIDLMTYDDCLALLDGRLKQLTTLIVTIDKIEYSSNVYNLNNLPNLKCFSLTTSCCSTVLYDTQILSLFRRMLNLEELTLYITIKNRTTLIDGIHISNEILVHMPRLHIFDFCISTNINMDHLGHFLSKDDIQQTFTNTIYRQVDCIISNGYNIATYCVFSLPFMFDCLESIGNTFPNIIFSNVTRLTVNDIVPFKHEFFHRIAWSFPLLKHLWVINRKPQGSKSDKLKFNYNQFYSIVKFPYLISLRLDTTYIHYTDQFLNETKTHLPRLTKLTICYCDLYMVTRNFRRGITRLNCRKIKQLIFNTIIMPRIKRSKSFNDYFPVLESFVCPLLYEYNG